MTLNSKQLAHLHLLNISPPEVRKKLLKNIDKSCIKALCECALNILNGNVPLTTRQKKALSKHKCALRKLKDRKVSLFQKRRIVSQQGGFLNILIPAVLSLLTGLITK